MIPNPNYSDYYKFCTSFGLLLIVASIAIYLFFMNLGYNSIETYLVNYSPEKLSQAGYSNDTIQSIQNFYRAKLSLFSGDLIFLIPILSLIMLAGGFILFFYGLFKWSKKQKKQDIQDERLSLEAEMELEKLKAKQTYERQLAQRLPIHIEYGK